ncbi:MAG: thiamine phosphate synthase [Prevotella sp.]|nr:thiamine phosphate synthase [Prevotella sp.]MDD5895436.1 thiamine phosphate synthase [Prevotellaceae bacterium]
MKLIIKTKSTFFVEEDKILTALFEEGLDNLHLYKPGASPMYSERLLTLLPDDSYDLITVHEHFYLKEEYGLRGIHIDDDSMLMPEKYRGRVSRTVELPQLTKDMKKKFDYVFLKNTFAGDGDGGELPTNRLEQAAKAGLIDKKTYACGGVTIDNIKVAKELGFGGVVIDNDLWDRFDIHRQLDYKELISHFEKLIKSAK